MKLSKVKIGAKKLILFGVILTNISALIFSPLLGIGAGGALLAHFAFGLILIVYGSKFTRIGPLMILHAGLFSVVLMFLYLIQSR